GRAPALPAPSHLPSSLRTPGWLAAPASPAVPRLQAYHASAPWPSTARAHAGNPRIRRHQLRTRSCALAANQRVGFRRRRRARPREIYFHRLAADARLAQRLDDARRQALIHFDEGELVVDVDAAHRIAGNMRLVGDRSNQVAG